MDDNQPFYDYLEQEIIRLGFNPKTCRLGNAPSSGAGEIGLDFVLDSAGGRWRVYVFERGKDYDQCWFENRRDAVYFLFLQLMFECGGREYPDVNFKDMPGGWT